MYFAQAFPYLVMLFIVPMHFLTHELLLFATGIWTNNIHDCLHSGYLPANACLYAHHVDYAGSCETHKSQTPPQLSHLSPIPRLNH
jgi:hypothetical protein